MTSTQPVTIACERCARALPTRLTGSGLARLPRSWKRHQDRVWCDRCWRSRYVLRAITIPVAGPVDAEWPALREALRTAWRDATTVANWAVLELAKADVVRTPAMERLPAMPRVYLYPGARAVAPGLPSASVVAILQAVERRYRAARYRVVWLRQQALPTYRYPAPLLVHNSVWSVRVDEHGHVVLAVRLASARWTLRLRGGAGFRRQLAAVRQLVRGEAIQGELALYARGRDVLAKMVMWLPRRTPAAGRDGTLYVRTGGDHLWTYHVDDGEPRHYNADHVRRWIAAYDRQRMRLADDVKAEKRPEKRRGRSIVETRTRWAERFRARMDSWTHEATAMLSRYADRQRVARVVYDDRDRSYLPHAPWHLLRERLRDKLGAVGIELELVASADVVGDASASLDGVD